MALVHELFDTLSYEVPPPENRTRNNQDSTALFSRLCIHNFVRILGRAEDIYTAAGWESMYQNGYVHGSPSRFSAESAIYTAAGCQHIITIYTAAVPEQFQTINTAAVCLHKIAI